MKTDERDWGFATRAIHIGQAPDASTGATIVPIYATTTYTQSGLGQHKGYEYGRGDNPTREALEQALASLEHGQYAFTFGSGMAAIDAVLRLLRTGDQVIAGRDLYGGAYRLFERVYREHQVTTEYVDANDLMTLRARITPQTRLLWLETPTNPLLQVADIQALVQLAHDQGMWVAVDNTFASPYLQNPLDLGADMVVHSMTKYIGGHSDVIGGAVVTNDRILAQNLKFLQNAVGAILGPFEAWLLLRGIKTLSLRMNRHCENAQIIRERLLGHAGVETVYYPGSLNAEQERIVREQMRAPGGMLSFVAKPRPGQSPLDRAREVLSRLRIFSLAESLGGVESLAGHPATMTHAAIPATERQQRGIVDNLIRLSVGIEDPDDLLEDLEEALE